MKNLFTLLFCIVALAANSQNISNGLMAHYQFTNNANDDSGNNFHANPNGTVLCTDRYNYSNHAYSFDGVYDHIIVPNNDSLKPDFPFSISIWFKIDAFRPPYTQILYTSDEGIDYYSGFYLGVNSVGRISAGYGDGGITSPNHRVTKHSNTMVNTSSWHNVIAVFNGLHNIELYINCVHDAGYYSGNGGPMQTTSNPGCIGRSFGHNAYNHFDGKIDDIRLYNRALNIEDISYLCQENPYLANETTVKNELTIYPNPAHNVLNIDLADTDYTDKRIEIYNPLGKLVYLKNTSSTKTKINLNTSLKKGIYFLRVVDTNQKLIGMKKIVIQ